MVDANQDVFVGDDGNQEAAAQAQKLQARVREAKQRAIEAKEQQEKQRQQTKQVRGWTTVDSTLNPQTLPTQEMPYLVLFYISLCTAHLRLR